jgi:hypothetical protein
MVASTEAVMATAGEEMAMAAVVKVMAGVGGVGGAILEVVEMVMAEQASH